MSNIKPFYSKDTIHQQSCEWISKIDRGLSEDEKQEFRDWIKLSDAHQDSLFDVANLFDELSVLNELSGLFPLRDKETTAPRRVFSEKVRFGIAASLTLAVITSVTWLFNAQINHESANLVALQSRVAETQIGEQRPISLNDGSVIHLNTNSQVEISFSNLQRKITLVRGEAHFDVAHDPSRPFVVVAGDNTVTAVGTAFNVELLNQEHFELLVTEGKVLVKEGALKSNSPGELLAPSHPMNAEGMLVKSGEKVFFDGSNSPLKTLSLDQVQRDLAWQQGMVVFQGEPLEEALFEVSRYTSIQFEVNDADLKQTRVAGYFKAGDIDGLLFALKNNFDIQSKKVDERTILLSSDL